MMFWHHKHFKLFMGYLLVTFFVLCLTRLDWVVHNDAYYLPSPFKPTFEWLISYWIPYGLLYFGVALAFLGVTRSWKHFIPLTFFFCVGGQDLIFFGWGGFQYPTGDWTWMTGYRLFGTWTTTTHFSISCLSIILALAIVKGVQKIGESHGYMARGNG